MDCNKGPEFDFFGELTTEDFQQKLYEWLEERGVLPGLRTYLRHQLISALKNTHLSSEYLNRRRSHLSPKIQAVNLMVAEYLFVQNYHYTISVFHSEEPRIDRLSKKIKITNENDASPKYFKERDVEDILESLNLEYKSAFAKEVFDIYFNEKKDVNDISLLQALFQALENVNEPKMYLNPSSYRETFKYTDKQAKSNHQEDEMMSKTSTSKTDLANNHLQKVKYLHNKSSTAQQESEFSVERNREELERRVEIEVKKVHQELEKEVSAYKKKLEEDFMLKQQQILEFTNILRDQQIQHQLHYEQIQKKEEILKEKERRLEFEQKQENQRLIEKQNEIIWAQNKLEEDFRRLKYEQNSIKFFQKEMEAGRKQITEVAQLLRNSQLELNLLQSLPFDRQIKNEGSDRCNHQVTKGTLPEADTFHVVQSVHSLQEHAIQACQETIYQLKDKNKKLQSLANEQQSKINALTTTALSLNSQIEEATAALRLLSTQDDHKPESFHFQPQHINLPTFHPEDRIQLTMEKEREKAFDKKKAFLKKRVERTAKTNPKEHAYTDYLDESDESANSATSSPTEEILREAKHRLELLKMESDAVDRQYFNFKMKHLSESAGISAFHSNNTVPQNSHPLEKEKSLLNPIHVPPTLQRLRSDLMLPYQQQQTNHPLHSNDTHREQNIGQTENSESFVNHLVLPTETSLRNQNQRPNMRQTNANLPSQTNTYLPSTSSNFHLATFNSQYQTNGMGINLAVVGLKNNSQMLPDLNAVNLNKVSQPDGEAKYGNTHFESNTVTNNRIKNDASSIDVKENLHKFPIEQTHTKDGINHQLKENASSTNTGSNIIIQNHLEKEKRDNTEIEKKNALTSELEVIHSLNNKENTNKHIKKLPSDSVRNQESDQEDDADAAESQVSQSRASSLHESSSPKLSIGISENKDGGDDLW